MTDDDDKPPSRPSWDKRLDRATWDKLMGRGERPAPKITEPAPPPRDEGPDTDKHERVDLRPAEQPGPPWDRRITREDWNKLFENAESLPKIDVPDLPLAEGSGWTHDAQAFAHFVVADGSHWDGPAFDPEIPVARPATLKGIPDPGASSSFPEISIDHDGGMIESSASSSFPEISVEPPAEERLPRARRVVYRHDSDDERGIVAKVVDVELSGEHQSPRPDEPALASDLVTTSPAHRPLFATAVPPPRLASDFVVTMSIHQTRPALDDAAELGVQDVEDAGASQPHHMSAAAVAELDDSGMPEELVTTWQQLRIDELQEIVEEPEPRNDEELDLRPAPDRAERSGGVHDPTVGVGVRRPVQPGLDDSELHRRAMRRAVFDSLAARKPPEQDTAPAERADTDDGPEELPPPPAGPVKKGTLLALLGFAAYASLGNAACGQSDGLVLWHAYNGAEKEALEVAASKWNAAHADAPLELVAVPYGAFGDKLTSAIPNGNGPDLFIYSLDRLGDWADSGVIEPLEFWLDDAALDGLAEEAVSAMAYRGSLYGLPLATKSLALFYRTSLVPTPPATTDELFALAAKMPKDVYALAYTNVDLYGHAPWLFGFGGRVLDGDTLAIATPEAANAMAFAHDLVARGVSPEHSEGPVVATLFNDGKAAMAISGPWFVADLKVKDWKVATLPVVSSTGLHAAPFLDGQGVMMSSRSHDKDRAFAVMQALVSDENATERARRTHQVVPNNAAYQDPEVARDDVVNAFRAQLSHTSPMPSSPTMRMVWTPYKTALGEVIAGRAQPGPQLRAVEGEIRRLLDGAPQK